MSQLKLTTVALAGFDRKIYQNLSPQSNQAIFYLACASVFTMVYGGIGLGYGAALAGRASLIALLLGLVGAVFCRFLVRMLNAGSGYALHSPKAIERWSPSWAASGFLMIFGALLTAANSLVIYQWVNPGFSLELGLFKGWQQFWQDKIAAIVIVCLNALIFAAFSWLRWVFLPAYRDYEKARSLLAKTFIAQSQQQSHREINQHLDRYRQGEQAALHFADNPYQQPFRLFKQAKPHYLRIKEVHNQPTLFNATVGDILFGKSYYRDCATLMRLLGLSAKGVQSRLLSHPHEASLLSVFAEEIRWRHHRSKNTEAPTPIPSTEPAEHYPCLDCDQTLTAIDTQGGFVHVCQSCQGSLFEEKKLQALFGRNASHSDWYPKTLSKYQGPRKLEGQHQQSIGDDYLLEMDKDSAERLGSQRAQLTYFAHSGHYWFRKHQLKTTRNFVDHYHLEHAQAQQAKLSGGLLLLQILSGIPKKIYHPVVDNSTMAIKALIVLLVFAFGIEYFFSDWVEAKLLFNPSLFSSQPWTAISSLFFHSGPWFLCHNCLLLWVFGRHLNAQYGNKVVLILWLSACTLGAIAYLLQGQGQTLLGCSASIYGLMGAYWLIYGNQGIRFIGIKIGVIWFIGGKLLLDIISANLSSENIAWLAHLGGFASAVAIAYVIKHCWFANRRIPLEAKGIKPT